MLVARKARSRSAVPGGLRRVVGSAQREHLAEKGPQGGEVSNKHADAILGISPYDNIAQSAADR